MPNKFRKVTKLPDFIREFKNLGKRFRSLEVDLQTFIDAQLYLYHKLEMDNGGVLRLNHIGFDTPQIFKAKKFACKALKGRGVNSGIRIIYAYFPEQDEIQLIEIYFKADKEKEDRIRLKKLYS